MDRLRVVRSLAASGAAVGWSFAALVAASAYGAWSGRLGPGTVARVHWAAVLAGLVLVGWWAPFVAFAGSSNWKRWGESRRPWLVAAGGTLVALWLATWAAVAVAGKVVGP